jgi:DNA-binding transcriptional LysR family regulator
LNEWCCCIHRSERWERPIELRQLQCFIAVAEERHFTRAARRLQISQSGLSTTIQSLERDLGTGLLFRNTRNVELTDAGSALLPDARRALASADAGRNAVAAVQGLLRGRVAVGSGKALQIDMVAVIKRFRAQHPGVEVHVHQAGSETLLEEVRTGQLDFAPVGLPGALPPELVAIPIASEVAVLACAKAHPLARRRDLALSALADETFVDLDRGWGVRAVNDRAFRDAGIERRIAIEVNDVDTLLEFVAHGLGVALVPGSVSRRSKQVSYVALDASAPIWDIVVAVPTERPLSAAAQALLDMVMADRELGAA